MDSRKRGSMLTVNSNGHKPGGFGIAAGPSGTLRITKGPGFFDPAHPAAYCFCMGRGENGNAPMIYPSPVQGNDCSPLSSPFPCKGKPQRGFERIVDGYQPGLHDVEEVFEVFFSAATSWSKERVIPLSPSRDR